MLKISPSQYFAKCPPLHDIKSSTSETGQSFFISVKTVLILSCLSSRLKRLYASQDLTTLLEERGVLTSDLMPHKDFNMRVDLTKADPKNKRLYPPFLSLDIFDNTEHDCRNPQEWLNLGVVKRRQKPVPGKALLSLTGKDVADPDRYTLVALSGRFKKLLIQ